MATEGRSESSPWEFRARGGIAFAIYFVGFFAGYSIAYAVGGNITSTYALLGSHWGDPGVRAGAAVIAALTVAGFVLRSWASSYHGAGVVYSDRIETGTLTAAGPYRYVRNPLYLGNLLQAVGIGALGPPPATIIIIVLLSMFLYRLIFLEERYLREAQGDAYARYCAVVPRMLPRLSAPPIAPSGQHPNVTRGLITELGTLGFAIWMIYYATATPFGPNRTFVALFWAAIVLFIVGGIANRR
jgi:protein-S-isoprenylcysteine O-methyltransferase Ste14